MKTFMARKEEIKRKWYVVDADGKTLGRLAAAVATVLKGKNKPEYTPHCDTGDHVIVVNAEKIVLTGNKLRKKVYFRHSGYVGGDRYTTAGMMMAKRPQRLLELAVKGMLPKNSLGRQMFRKLRVYCGAGHPHQAQQPVELPYRERR
ncbi:MAG: 50S ribosomal protein L13 [Negativicutes bacterium]|nr:50S ribosomal protein L13 [Negativicutes bacterium]